MTDFEINGIKFNVAIPDPEKHVALEVVYVKEKNETCTRYGDLFIVKSIQGSKARYDICILDEKKIIMLY